MEADERNGFPPMVRRAGRTRLPPAAREDFASAMTAITQRARQARTSLSGLILAEFRDKFDRVSRDASLTRMARSAQIARLFEEQAARHENMHRTLSHDMGAECYAVCLADGEILSLVLIDDQRMLQDSAEYR
jgi:hypothetical protein